MSIVEQAKLINNNKVAVQNGNDNKDIKNGQSDEHNKFKQSLTAYNNMQKIKNPLSPAQMILIACTIIILVGISVPISMEGLNT